MKLEIVGYKTSRNRFHLFSEMVNPNLFDNMSDYLLQKSGGLFYKVRPTEHYFNEQDIIVDISYPADFENLDAVIKPVNEFLKGLREFWIIFHHKRLFRKKIKPKLNYYKRFRNNTEISGK